MAEEIEIAQDEQVNLQGENPEQEQHESEENQEIENSENVETQEEDDQNSDESDKKPNEGMLKRINKLTRRLHENRAEFQEQLSQRDEFFKEQERILQASLERLKELEGGDFLHLPDEDQQSLRIEKSILERQTKGLKLNLESAESKSIINNFNSGVKIFESEFSDYKDEANKVEKSLDPESIKYLLSQGASEDLVGQKIVYYLGKNEKELNLFKKLDPSERRQELFELKKKVLKGELSFPETSQKPKTQVKPTPKVGSSSSSSVDYSKLSPFSPEYEAYRKSLGFK